MSKELIEVKQDGLKNKLKELLFLIIISVLGASIVFVSFLISYNKMHSKNATKKDLSHIEVVPEAECENKTASIQQDVESLENEKTYNIEDSEKQEVIENKSEINSKLPQWNENVIDDIKGIYSSDEKQIYLTFDDGPSKEVTPLILATLKEEEVPATFFVLGKCVDKYPELVKQAYEEGHFIANHGYTHTYSEIYSSVDSVVNEYNRTNEAIKNALENEEYDPHLFRFPGGSSGGPYDSLKSQAKQFLADNQVASTNWNSLTSDAAGKTTVKEQYYEVIDTQGDKTSLIILLHDAADKKVTADTVKLLIKHYKEEGYEFKNFYDIFSEEEADTVTDENKLEKDDE